MCKQFALISSVLWIASFMILNWKYEQICNGSSVGGGVWTQQEPRDGRGVCSVYFEVVLLGQHVLKRVRLNEYDGEFFNDTRHGNGTMTSYSGNRFDGRWSKNRIASGVAISADGTQFVGRFNNGSLLSVGVRVTIGNNELLLKKESSHHQYLKALQFEILSAAMDDASAGTMRFADQWSLNCQFNNDDHQLIVAPMFDSKNINVGTVFSAAHQCNQHQATTTKFTANSFDYCFVAESLTTSSPTPPLQTELSLRVAAVTHFHRHLVQLSRVLENSFDYEFSPQNSTIPISTNDSTNEQNKTMIGIINRAEL